MPASFNPSVLFDQWNGLPLTNPNSFFRTAQMSPSSKILFSWRFYQAIGGVPQLSLKSLFVSLLCFPDSSDSKASSCNAGDPGSIPGLGRSRGEGNGNPVQYFCLENPMDGEAWQAIVHGVVELDTTEQLTPSQFLFNCIVSFFCLQFSTMNSLISRTVFLIFIFA